MADARLSTAKSGKKTRRFGGRQTPHYQVTANVERKENAPFPDFRSKLWDMFNQLEREFEAVYAENIALRKRIEELTGQLDSQATITGGVPASGTDAELAEGAPLDQDLSIGTVLTKKHSASRVSQRLRTYRATASKASKRGPAVTFQVRKELCGHRDGIWDVAYSRTGPVVGTASADRTARLWCPESHLCLLEYRGHSGSVNSIRFHPTEQLACTGGGDGQAHVWPFASNHSNTTSVSAQVNADGVFLDDIGVSAPSGRPSSPTGSDDEGSSNEQGDAVDKFTVVKAPSLQLIGHSGVVIACDWLADGQQLATGSWDRTVKVWDTGFGNCLHTLTGYDQEMTNVCGHPSQQLLLTSGRDTNFHLWDLNASNRHPIHVVQAHSATVTTAVFAPKQLVVSGSDDRTVKVWEMRQMRQPLVNIRVGSAANRLAMSPNGKVLAVPQDSRHVRLFDANGVRLEKSSQKLGHRRLVTSVAWGGTDDSTMSLYSGSFDKRLLSWGVCVP